MVKTKRSLIAALIAVIWAITAVLFLIPNVSAQAYIPPFDITGGYYGIDYTYTGGVLTVKTPTEITIRNADPNTPITDTIVVESGVSANIILAGVNIDVSTTTRACAFKIEDDSTGNVTITLADGSVNVLKSGEVCAGLQKNGDNGKLTIQGNGKLTVTGGDYAAGIGGGDSNNSTHITISGGIITANGGDYGAGIGGGIGAYGGGGGCGCGSYISITSGTVTANGGIEAAGIGGGIFGSGSNITISDGAVTAIGGNDAAGIGGGYNGEGTDVTISGGAVTANGGYCGAGIGGGNKSNGSNIKISGGSVKATAGSYANAIGGGQGNGAVIPTNGTENVYLAVIDNPYDENIYIDGKLYSPQNHKAADSTDTKLYAYLTGKNRTVKVGNDEIEYLFSGSSLDVLASDLTITGDNLVYGTDYTYPASTGVLTILTDKKVTISGSTTKDTIVVGKNKDADITLDGVNIDVSTIYYACAFKIEYDSTKNVTITLADGSVNSLKSGENCAGLQKNGSSTDIGNLTIQGNGKLTVTGGEYAAGIGGGCADSGSNITISGGTVTASGGYCGAGIGGGSDGNGTNITISSGIVTATGGEFGAGIGGGSDGNGTNITISGGTVTANSEALGASIGGGIRSSGSYITISGGSVKATASSSANAIGGGLDGNGAVTPTLADKTTPVYLLEINNPDGKAITINGKTYPTNHGDEKKIYAYLPAKTLAEPNTLKIGESTAGYYYDTASKIWHGVADIPDADDTEFIYNGREQTYAIPESILYTISGNKQKNAGDHTVTVALTDKVNNTWSDGTTEDKEYTFTIAKAQPELTVTAKPTSDIAGKTVTVTASAVNPENTALDDIPDIVLTYKVGDGDETSFTDSFVIPEDTAIGTVITVKAKTAEDGNYKSSEAETKVNVSDCTHNDVNAKWESDSTGHWHICNYCSKKVDFAAHTFGSWKITVSATEASDGKKEHSCTVCGYTEEEAVKYTAAEKAAEEADKALDDFTGSNDTTADDIINWIRSFVDDNITIEISEIRKIPATEDSEGSITVVIIISDDEGNTAQIEKVIEIEKLPETEKTVYYPIIVSGNVSADRISARAGDAVNVKTAFGYDIIVTANGKQIAQINEKGSFVMPNCKVYVTAVRNETFAAMSNAWNHSYVYSYDSDMNRIKISSDSKRGTVTIKLGSEYAGREFVIYSGRKSTKVKVTEGVLDENGEYTFKADEGKNYTLVIK